MDKKVHIVAGGTSLKGFDFEKFRNQRVITVNKTIFDIPWSQFFVTMDYSFLNKIDRKKFNEIGNIKIFIANHEPDYMQVINGKLTDTRSGMVYNLDGFHDIIESHKSSPVGLDLFDFAHGSNSGYCALQVAILANWTEIYLHGFDLTCDNETHHHGGYGQNPEKFKQKLDEYYKHFEDTILYLKLARPEIKIYSCSKISRLNELIPYVDPNEVL